MHCGSRRRKWVALWRSICFVDPRRDFVLFRHVRLKGLWGVVVLSHGGGCERAEGMKKSQISRTLYIQKYIRAESVHGSDSVHFRPFILALLHHG